MAQTEKEWPTSDQLLAWYIHYYTDECTDLTPDNILTAIRNFRTTSPVATHSLLHGQYREFRDKFFHVDGLPSSS